MHHCFELQSRPRKCINGQRLETERGGFPTYGASKITKIYLGLKEAGVSVRDVYSLCQGERYF